MAHMMKCRPFILATLFTVMGVASAQTARQREEMSIQGYAGQATIVRVQGHAFVDVEDLARITHGSLSFEGNRIIMTPSHRDASPQSDDDTSAGFSRPFMKAGIEATASIREWGGMLKVIVENGYPVGKAMAGNTIRAYQGRAGDNVSLASAATSTDDDHRGLELLRNEFNDLQVWADNYVDARNSLSAADISTSENPLKDDQNAQKIIQCGQFLAQMFASGTFQDEVACH